MVQKKSAGKFAETGGHPSIDQEPRTRVGGRPRKLEPRTSLTSHVLALYVGFMRARAPGWSERQVDLKIFGAAKGNKKGDPAYRLDKLAGHQAMFRLQNDSVSLALMRADYSDRFEGGLQVLYHPFAHVLECDLISKVHALMVQCRHGEELFEVRRQVKRRAARSTLEDLDWLARKIIASRGSARWSTDFLNFVAIALGLLREATLRCDHEGVRSIKRWILVGNLLFAEWGESSPDATRSMDEAIQRIVRRTFAPKLVTPYEVMLFMMDHVAEQGYWIGRNRRFLTSLFLAIRDGRWPDDSGVIDALIQAFGTLPPEWVAEDPRLQATRSNDT